MLLGLVLFTCWLGPVYFWAVSCLLSDGIFFVYTASARPVFPTAMLLIAPPNECDCAEVCAEAAPNAAPRQAAGAAAVLQAARVAAPRQAAGAGYVSVLDLKRMRLRRGSCGGCARRCIAAGCGGCGRAAGCASGCIHSVFTKRHSIEQSSGFCVTSPRRAKLTLACSEVKASLTLSRTNAKPIRSASPPRRAHWPKHIYTFARMAATVSLLTPACSQAAAKGPFGESTNATESATQAVVSTAKGSPSASSS